MFNFDPLNNNSINMKEEPQTIPENETFSNVSAFNPVIENFNSAVEQPMNVQPPTIEGSQPVASVIENSPIENTQLPPNPISMPFQNRNTEPIGDSIPESIPTFTTEPQTIPSTVNSLLEEKTLEPEFEPFNPYALNDNNEFTQDNELNKYRIGSEINTTPIFQEPKNTYTVADMRTVINTIRECAKTIENYGFEVDLDELDLADSYQVNFKINKKQ